MGIIQTISRLLGATDIAWGRSSFTYVDENGIAHNAAQVNASHVPMANQDGTVESVITGIQVSDTADIAALAAHTGGVTVHAASTNLEKVANKGAVSGYAGLDAAQKVPTANLGGAGANSTKYLRGDQTWQTPPTGRILQWVYTEYSGYLATSSVIPQDNSIPQNTEGAAIPGLDTTITPQDASSFLFITATVNLAGSSSPLNNTLALFRDTAANAIAATVSSSSGPAVIHIRVASNLAVATTFKLRFGAQSGWSCYVNGLSGAGLFLGTNLSSILVEEYI